MEFLRFVTGVWLFVIYPSICAGVYHSFLCGTSCGMVGFITAMVVGFALSILAALMLVVVAALLGFIFGAYK